MEARFQPSLNDSESSFLPSYTSTCIVSVGLCISLTCEIPDLMYSVFSLIPDPHSRALHGVGSQKLFPE